MMTRSSEQVHTLLFTSFTSSQDTHDDDDDNDGDEYDNHQTKLIQGFPASSLHSFRRVLCVPQFGRDEYFLPGDADADADGHGYDDDDDLDLSKRQWIISSLVW